MNRSSHVRQPSKRTQGEEPARKSLSLAVREETCEADVTCDVDVVHLDSVKSARAALPDDIRVAHVAELLGLLSSPTRLKMLLALQPKARGPRRELCVCDLATVTGASKSLTSHQLRLLRASGLVEVRRAGKLAYYRLVDGVAMDLLGNLLTMALRRVRDRDVRARDR